MKRSKTLDLSFEDVKYEQYINNLHDRLPQLVDPSDIDCKRWPWELLQNAKDTVVKRENPQDRYVDITIKHYIDSNGEKMLYFEHNGDQFTNKAIVGLIWKFSAEKRNEQTEDGLTRDKQSTGRFGTGFMTTHALSLTVDVSGSLFHDDPEIMRNVSVDFTLHREGPDDTAYKEGVNLTEKEVCENMGRHPIPQGEILPTRFTYHLNKEASEKAVKMGIDNVRANAAQTMLFCPSVHSIKVIDEVNKNTFTITREKNHHDERKNVVKEVVFIEENSDSSEPIMRRFISTEIEEYSEPISSHWKVRNRNLRLNVAVEVDKDNNIVPISSSSPAVYCSLPLIGFESMSLPFYINSNDFEPATERTSLYLKKKRFEYQTNEDSNVEEKFYLQSGVNWSIFERSISLYEKVVDYLIENEYKQRYHLINGLGDILNGAWGTETKNCLASRFILPLRKMLIGKDLVKTSEGYRSIKSEVKFVECAKESNLHKLYKICEPIYGKTNIAVEEENEKWVLRKWRRFTFDNDFEEKKSENENPAFPTIKYDEIVGFIEAAKTLDNLQLILSENDNMTEDKDTLVKAQKLEWLNQLYEWIKISKITNLSEKKIVPNRLGVFCSTEQTEQGCNLKDASEISVVIFDLMKQIELDWDKNLLMEGVKHITLAKETKDNITIAIKNRSKEIRDKVNDSDESKLTKLLPILLALPKNEDGRIEEFLKKRKQIVSILKVIFPNICKERDHVSLDLKAETWEDTDRWFMNLVAYVLANRKHLDVIKDGDTEDEKKAKYCTSKWLSDTLNFMFQKSYLHQEDIMSKEGKKDTLAIIPNRYGDFCPINELHTQGDIPEELLDDELNKTGYDVKANLLYKDFTLNDKVSINNLMIPLLTKKYNSFFNGKDGEDDKLAVARFIIHLIPECGDHYKETRDIYNLFVKTSEEGKKTKTIATSDLNIWKDANEYLIKYLCNKASELESIDKIGNEIFESSKDPSENYKDQLTKNGLKWLNRLMKVQSMYNIELNDELKLIPDWYGKLHPSKEVIYDGKVLEKYKLCDSLVDLIDSDLWSHFPKEEKQKGEENMTSSIAHPHYNAEKLRDNTDEKLFSIVDRLVFYCSEHNSSEWRSLLKFSIQTLIKFFEANESKPNIHNADDAKLLRLFPKTYKERKSLSYDYIYDAETKARFSQINENYSSDEIEILIEEKDLLKKLLQNKDLITIQKEFPNTDFKSLLDILRREQGDFSTKRFQQNISDERKREIGDKGECYVYEMLCKRFGSSNVIWSNYAAPTDESARCVRFNDQNYSLKTTSHDFDFKVSYNDKTIYVEVKTTVGNIKSSKDFPLIFETKEWEWIDVNNEEDVLHYIVRVFDIENNPKAYFLKQELNIG